VREAVALAGVVVAVAGCGGADRLSTAEWVRQANAICAHARARAQALGTPATSDEFLALAPRANRASERALAGLRELEPPSSLEQRVKGMLGDYERVVKLQAEIIAGFRSQRKEPRERHFPGDPRFFSIRENAVEATDLVRRGDRRAVRLHVKECADVPWFPGV
jgi:hypothetical protein